MISSRGASTVVVVSFWDQRETVTLHRLLTHLDQEAPQAKFHIVVVVNSTSGKVVPLPSLKSNTSILYRENFGMNIGAWDYGWRALFNYDRYIFLQDECIVLKRGWTSAYAEALDDPETGLVGETYGWGGSWSSVFDETIPATPKMLGMRTYYSIMKNWNIDPGTEAKHLRSIIWATRRQVLEEIDGFPLGRNKTECIASEIGVSRKVAALGLKFRTVGSKGFDWISHIQWDRRLRPPNPALHLDAYLHSLETEELLLRDER